MTTKWKHRITSIDTARASSCVALLALISVLTQFSIFIMPNSPSRYITSTHLKCIITYTYYAFLADTV